MKVKRHRLLALLISFSFLFSVAFGVTGTYNQTYSVDVHSQPGVAKASSANATILCADGSGNWVLCGDGDYFSTGTVSGYLASGATWGFTTFDASTGAISYGPAYTSINSTAYDISGFHTQKVGIWVDNSAATSESWVYVNNWTSNGGAVINLATPQGYTTPPPGGGSTPGTGTSNYGCPPPPDWNKVAQTFYDTWKNNLPPIPAPPDPSSTVTAPQPTQPAMPTGNTQLQQPVPDNVPQKPTEQGTQPFDLSQGQPSIPVDKSQSKPFTVQDPVANLPHDAVNNMPAPGNSDPSPYTNPSTPSLSAPSYQGTQTTAGDTTAPQPTQQPTTVNNAPTPTTPQPTQQNPTTPSRMVGSSNPNPSYN